MNWACARRVCAAAIPPPETPPETAPTAMSCTCYIHRFLDILSRVAGAHLRVYLHLCLYHIYISICIYICTYVCMYVYTYTYIYIYSIASLQECMTHIQASTKGRMNHVLRFETISLYVLHPCVTQVGAHLCLHVCRKAWCIMLHFRVEMGASAYTCTHTCMHACMHIAKRMT